MSKFRVEFKTSRILVFFQLFTYLVFVLSVLIWKKNVLQYQWIVQAMLLLFITYFSFRAIIQNIKLTLPIVVFSQQGDWLEIFGAQQISWQVTNKSRITSLLLFIHLMSPNDQKASKWRLVFKDQISEKSYRRLCRVVLFQQHTKEN